VTGNQKRSLFAAWGGIVLDGMDSFIFALVLVPAMKELLPKSGIVATTATLGTYGSLLFSVFLIGWGLSSLWGPLADRFGRVRTMMLAVLCYSLFTFLGCVAQNVWQLAIFRMFAGFGVGGEFVGAATLVAEELPENRRLQGAGFLNSAYYTGTFIAAALNYGIGAQYGWRAMFVVGGLPALFVAWIRYGVHEPERWKKHIQTASRVSARQSFMGLFTPEYRVRTVITCCLALISMIGLWAGTVYAPGAVTQVALREGYNAKQAAQIASWATMLLSAGTILACLTMHLMARSIGRRGAVGVFFAIMAVSVATGFGYAFYLTHNALAAFITCLFFVGIGGGSFSVYLAWIPEQYRTECRGSALALAFGMGRFVAAGATFLVGMGVAAYGSIGVPVALTSLAFVAGLFLLRFAVETRDQLLPD
jgi:MFS family permease